MAKSLVIVESPTKVKTLKGFLGADFIVMGSKGHVRDLPKSGLAVDVKGDFTPKYELLPDRAAIINELRAAANSVETVYLASDPDREGEAIAWHIREALHLKNVRRIEFNEITKSAVQRALQNPRDIDMDRVNAQQARRVLDRIIGYQISPLLAKKLSNWSLSAGRVQSVALRLICEREREIQAFQTQEYWSITAYLSPTREKFRFAAKLLTKNGQKLEVTNETDATTLVDALRPLPFRVGEVKKREKRRNPSAPFITSTLQQEASRQLRFSAKRTMQVAQGLYEGVSLGGGAPVGLITYMRTDSTAIAKEAQASARDFITKRYGAQFAPDSPPQYKNRKSAQEAHEAVRPSDVNKVPDEIRAYLSDEQFKLYRLIWQRFVASQMKPAILDVTSVDITASYANDGDVAAFFAPTNGATPDSYGLRASGSVVKFEGFLKVYEEARDDDFKEADADDENTVRPLPALEKAQALRLEEIDPRQHFTQPPPRYTEATLVRSLEENGIGRPSTYAQIIATIQDRNYVESEQRRLSPTELGFLVNEKLTKHFPRIVDVGFTADVEEKLDGVEEGKQDWIRLLREFYDPFQAELALATEQMEKVQPVETDFPCPACGSNLLLRNGRFGKFFSCSNAECKTTMNVAPDGTPQARAEKVVPVVEGIAPDETRSCEKCSKPMVVRVSSKTGGAFWGCTGYPKCKNLVPIEGAVVTGGVAEKAEPVMTEHKCPNCGRPLAQRKGRFGMFLGCTGYPECKTIVNLDKEGNPRWPAPKSDGDEPDAPKRASKTVTKKPAAKASAKPSTAKSSAAKRTTTSKKPAPSKTRATTTRTAATPTRTSRSKSVGV